MSWGPATCSRQTHGDLEAHALRLLMGHLSASPSFSVQRVNCTQGGSSAPGLSLRLLPTRAWRHPVCPAVPAPLNLNLFLRQLPSQPLPHACAHASPDVPVPVTSLAPADSVPGAWRLSPALLCLRPPSTHGGHVGPAWSLPGKARGPAGAWVVSCAPCPELEDREESSALGAQWGPPGTPGI